MGLGIGPSICKRSLDKLQGRPNILSIKAPSFIPMILCLNTNSTTFLLRKQTVTVWPASHTIMLLRLLTKFDNFIKKYTVSWNYCKDAFQRCLKYSVVHTHRYECNQPIFRGVDTFIVRFVPKQMRSAVDKPRPIVHRTNSQQAHKIRNPQTFVP